MHTAIIITVPCVSSAGSEQRADLCHNPQLRVSDPSH